MANEIIFSKKNLAPLIFEAFSYLQEKGLVVSLFRYASETVPNSGKEDERLVRLDDGNGHKLTGLFLKASKESMLERNARRAPRWFESPFIINGQEYYLSSQWNASGDFQLTLPNLNYFLKECCRNESDGSTFSIYKSDDEFIFAQGKFEDNNEVLPQKSPDSKEHEIKQKPVLEEKVLPHQKIFFGAPGTGKSFKANAILGKNRKNCFSKSDHPKSNGYANDLCDVKNVGFEVWSIDNIEFLEKKLVSFESDNKVTNPRHSALRAYIDFFKKYREENRENRTTFHPDYDYAQFVGAYKPKKEGNVITYSFVPQVFAKAYAAAWKLYLQRDSRDSIGASPLQNDSGKDIQVYLVIEEINRGNCAQIFGDIFQLLDRDGERFSQYSIDADCDFAEWLKEDSILKTVWSDYEAKVGDGKLKLPPNLNILATMNTSDQSLFPMDSAFKRRFDWEYVPIKYAKDSDCGDDWKADEFKIVIGNSTYMWLDFLKKVNVDIDETTHSEDKQMGEFFIKPKTDDLKISFDEFRSKVLFYLWDSVYKDETERQAVFHFPYGDGDGKINSVTFQSLFGKDAEAIVNKIMENLKVEKVTA